jgi:hypothetical protein
MITNIEFFFSIQGIIAANYQNAFKKIKKKYFFFQNLTKISMNEIKYLLILFFFRILKIEYVRNSLINKKKRIFE